MTVLAGGGSRSAARRLGSPDRGGAGASGVDCAAPLPGAGPGPADLAGRLVPGAAMAADEVCYFTAVTLTGVAVTALLPICSAPIMIALLGIRMLGERLAPRVLASLLAGVRGAGLLVLMPCSPPVSGACPQPWPASRPCSCPSPSCSWGVLAFGERFSPVSAAGAALQLAVIAVLLRPPAA